MERQDRKIAVVGIGPRGLGALEALAEEAGDGAALPVDLFDPNPFPGAGPNFRPDESPLCLLNIPVRDIAINPPSFARLGSFADWLDKRPSPDTFPARAELGRYLEARLAELLAQDRLAVARQAGSVTRMEPGEGGWRLLVDGEWHGPYAEVLLTLGQPAVEPDAQWAEWQDHAEGSGATLAEAYPARSLETLAEGWAGRVVAIRGLGLSAFDVLRALTVAQGGAFRDGRYVASGREPARILPFSLDGKPPFPKPETGPLDAAFEPLPGEAALFSDAMARAAEAGTEGARHLLAIALAPIVARILAAQGQDFGEEAVTDWLETEWTAPGSQETEGPLETLRGGIALAEGACAPTIGYAVGQVWRKMQDRIRAGFNPADTPPETAEALVGFDEGLKRYSYGPPVAASRELLALAEAGVVDLGLASDPDISLVPGAWELRADGRVQEVQVMIDGVLPSPDLARVTAPLVAGLLAEGWLAPLSDGLAAALPPTGR